MISPFPEDGPLVHVHDPTLPLVEELELTLLEELELTLLDELELTLLEELELTLLDELEDPVEEAADTATLPPKPPAPAAPPTDEPLLADELARFDEPPVAPPVPEPVTTPELEVVNVAVAEVALELVPHAPTTATAPQKTRPARCAFPVIVPLGVEPLVSWRAGPHI